MNEVINELQQLRKIAAAIDGHDIPCFEEAIKTHVKEKDEWKSVAEKNASLRDEWKAVAERNGQARDEQVVINRKLLQKFEEADEKYQRAQAFIRTSGNLSAEVTVLKCQRDRLQEDKIALHKELEERKRFNWTTEERDALSRQLWDAKQERAAWQRAAERRGVELNKSQSNLQAANMAVKLQGESRHNQDLDHQKEVTDLKRKIADLELKLMDKSGSFYEFTDLEARVKNLKGRLDDAELKIQDYQRVNALNAREYGALSEKYKALKEKDDKIGELYGRRGS